MTMAMAMTMTMTMTRKRFAVVRRDGALVCETEKELTIYN